MSVGYHLERVEALDGPGQLFGQVAVVDELLFAEPDARFLAVRSQLQQLLVDQRLREPAWAADGFAERVPLVDRHAFVFDVEAEPFVEQLHGVVLEEAAVDVGAEVLVEGPLEELVSGVYGLEELVAVAEEVGSVREAGQVSAARSFDLRDQRLESLRQRSAELELDVQQSPSHGCAVLLASPGLGGEALLPGEDRLLLEPLVVAQVSRLVSGGEPGEGPLRGP